jgi:hypothetical protein
MRFFIIMGFKGLKDVNRIEEIGVRDIREIFI